MSEQNATCQKRKPYKTDVTDVEWGLIQDLIPPAVAKTGREPTDLREVYNTIRYQNRTGCPWDMLPNDLIARSTTFGYYKAWQENGVWELILDTLRSKVRVATPRVEDKREEPPPGEAKPEETPAVEGKAQEPSAAEAKGEDAPAVEAERAETPSFVIMDSQSVKSK